MLSFFGKQFLTCVFKVYVYFLSVLCACAYVCRDQKFALGAFLPESF